MWKVIAGAVAGVVIVAIGAVLYSNESWPFEKSQGHVHLGFASGGPAEFLYLDSGRVIAYLAQIDGGTFASKEQTDKVSETLEGKVALQEFLQAGATKDEEHTISRVVTPTAAAQYFELLSDLENEPGQPGSVGVDNIGLGQFSSEVKGLEEGQFVRFETHKLRPPIYLNPYLAARQRTTMEALFPRDPGQAETAKVHLQRVRIHYFRHELGRNPRVTFKVQPLYPKQVEGIVKRRKRARKRQAEGVSAPAASAPALAEEATHASPKAARRRARKCQLARNRRRHGSETKLEVRRREQAVYLMPLDARRLTRERSLIKYGGGTFTVVGKVVRVFPEHGDSLYPAYIDSSTRETWERPLASAPSKLLCRTDPSCRKVARRSAAKAEARIEETRCSDLAALRGQTEIPVRGAVILPIAIYK
jgi:hypothetical protein